MAIVIRGTIINIKPLIKPLIAALILVLLLAAIFYWRKLPEINWQFLLGKLVREKPSEKAEVVESGKEEMIEEKPLIPPLAKRYQETAQPREGITHLARRALKRYLQENPQEFQVTPEHKIYIEDYLAKKLGGRWLKLGETLEFSEGLIKEALERAQNLTQDQLQNLTQYSQLVPSLMD